VTAHNLNLEFRLWLTLLVINPPQSSRELLGIEPLKRVVRRKEPQRADPVDTPINRAAWVGVDPVLPSSSSRRSHFRRHSFPAILQPLRSDARIPIQSPVPVVRALAPPLRAALLCACASKVCVPLDPIQTLAEKWRWRRLPSRTRTRHGSGRR
jgi:hypothetical protein